MSVPVLALFAFVAVVNSGILGGVLLWRGRHSNLFWLGLILLCVGFLLAVYALEQYDQVWISGWLRVSFDLVSLLLSCFLLEYVFGGLLGWRPHRAIYGPVAVYLIALAVFRNNFLAWFTIEILVLVQSFYTVLALVVCVRVGDAPWKSGRWSRTWVHVFILSAVFLMIHLAHLLRFLLSGRWDRDPAPVIGIIALIGMTSFALASSRFSRWMSPRPRLGAGKSRELLKKLDQVMKEQRLFVQPELNLATLAQAAESTAQNLSAALNSELGKTFYEYVTTFRVQEAERLLRDPEQAALSLEALGTESGFKSRSSFYSAFKNATGLTPGEYRESRSG